MTIWLVACAGYVLLSVSLMDACLSEKNRVAWVFLQILWWAVAAVSAVLTALSLRGIGYYENLYFGLFLIFSAPAIPITGGLAISFLFWDKSNEIANSQKNRKLTLALLIFLGIQGLIGCIVGIWPTR